LRLESASGAEHKCARRRSQSKNARAPIIQIVDPNYTVLVKIEKRRLPAAAAR
jgi:hypothetical protein